MQPIIFENEFIRQGILFGNETPIAVASRSEGGMEVQDVIREILSLAKLTQKGLAKTLSVSQGTISKWLAGTQTPNKRQWDAVLEVLAGDPRLVHLLPAAGGPTIARVPLLDEVSAGKLAASHSQIPVEDVPLLAFADLGRGEFFALKVQGDSMDRLSPDGSVIVVDRADRALVGGRCYVFAVRGEATYKLWHADPPYLAPYSTNPGHQPIFIKRQRDLEVIGRVRRTVLDL